MERRSFLKSIGFVMAAPAIVRAESLMKIVVPKKELAIPAEGRTITEFMQRWRDSVHDDIAATYPRQCTVLNLSESSELTVEFHKDSKIAQLKRDEQIVNSVRDDNWYIHPDVYLFAERIVQGIT